MGKKHKRRTVGPLRQEHFAALATGEYIAVPRVDGIARLIDTAIWLWFLEKDALPIHVLILAAYQCLEDLGKKSGKGPRLKATVEADKFTLAYDFLRHASSNPNTGFVFAPISNGPILFDAVTAFDRIFENLTMYMRTFRAYFILRPEPPLPDRDAIQSLLQYATEILPKGITVEDAMKVGRMEFFAKFTEMFAAQCSVKRL